DTCNHKALIAKGVINGEKVILYMPQTFMNLSGESVMAIMDFYILTVDDLIVFYDDIDLYVGKIRIREK
ncbi:aminoacyl-tRNA hydrolase, partial [Coprococcus eutactus]|uniref:aminoacyl-tRNA hydrolase n=1 Tax=Coprococcus eutactus TaxID=33043 RepID=UPI00210C3832